VGYKIKRLPYKKRTWKVQYQSYVGGYKTTDIPESSWPSLGFNKEMTVEQADAVKDKLNAKEHLERHSERRVNILTRLKTEQIEHTAYLNKIDVEEFEAGTLFGRSHSKRNKTESHWRAAKRVIISLKIEPSDWAYKKEAFFDYFSSNKWSLSYVQKVISVLNKWGLYLQRNYRTPDRMAPEMAKLSIR
jgi:hypothetical protein